VQAGLLVGLVPASLSVVAPVAGWIFDRAGSRALCTGGLAAVAGSLVLFALLGAHAGTTAIALALVLAGAGLGAFEAPNDGAVLGSLPPQRLGVGTASLGALRNLGMTIGVAVSATLIDLGVRAGSWLVGTRLAFEVGAAIAAAGAVAAALRPAGSPHRGLGWRLPVLEK
jgi:MFS family permease